MTNADEGIPTTGLPNGSVPVTQSGGVLPGLTLPTPSGCVQVRYFAAAGALGFDGFDSGHPPLVRAWKWPFRRLGRLDPTAFAVITKTVTRSPRTGRLTPWRFWRAARELHPLRERSMVNSVALTNPGIDEWAKHDYLRASAAGFPLVLSVEADTPRDAYHLGRYAACLSKLAAVQVNSCCPNAPPGFTNADWGDQASATADVIQEFLSGVAGRHPVIVKFGVRQPWEDIARRLDGKVAAFELINAVPWDDDVGRGRYSPLARYGYDGAVSGGRIVGVARWALDRYVKLGLSTPVISGGGVVRNHAATLVEEVETRASMGASAVSFGTAFLWNPSAPNRAVRQLEARRAARGMADATSKKGVTP